MILPIYAGLERLPDSLLEASGDLGASAGRTFRSVVLPLLVPVARRGIDLHLLADAGRLHHGEDRRRRAPSCSANLIYDNVGVANNLPLAAAARDRSRSSSSSATCSRCAVPVRWTTCEATPWRCRAVPAGSSGLISAGVLAVIYVPLLVVLVNSFNASKRSRGRPRRSRSSGGSKAATNEGSAPPSSRASRPGWARRPSRSCSGAMIVVRRVALPVLRPRDDQLRRDPARSRCPASSPVSR